MKLTNGILTVLTVGLLAILAPATAIGATITVCWDGSADYSTIQAGINAAVNGDEVVVCAGTYTGSGNKNLDFDGRAITVRGEAGPDSTIIDCEGGDRGFYFHSGEGPASIVEGFTITNGHAFGGGGIRCSDSSPTITNCTIIGNSVVGLCVGGGIYCPGGSPTITNCTISENWGGEIGGGFYCTGGNPAITNCTISGNSARLGGGGIYSVRSNLAITSCTISGNSTEIGGGIYTTDDATVSDCTISTNAAAYYGGGICCDWSSNTMFTNCMISGNWAASEGGGMFWIYRNYGNMTMVNCTMSGNWAPLGGGICCTGGGSPAMTNCTMSGNGARIDGGIRC